MKATSGLLAIAGLSVGLAGQVSSRVTAALPCTTIYDPGNGWVIGMCPTDPGVVTPMDVVLDGVPRGQGAYIRINHQSDQDPGLPEVAVVYASGFVRLKPNADPVPPIPFGSSFVLGPAYWSSTYYHNPNVSRLELDTEGLPNGPLRMHLDATNGAFDIDYDLVLPPPRDRQTRLHVSQRYTATAPVAIDAARRLGHEGFKLVQVSSMFINEGGACDSGGSDCHDSNAARYIDASGVRRQAAFNTVAAPGSIFATPPPLGSTWVDVLHTDDEGWQGNTPNVRVAFDELPAAATYTPQGWIASTTDPNDDNVGLWIHDDGPASGAWSAGQSATVEYWLLAEDDPPDPWSALGLRSGVTFLDFEGAAACFPVLRGAPRFSRPSATMSGRFARCATRAPSCARPIAEAHSRAWMARADPGRPGTKVWDSTSARVGRALRS